MDTKARRNDKNSLRAEVGEIDTRAPFHSVKDAVNLFVKGTSSGEKPGIKKSKPSPTERVLAKETQLHLAQKEVSRLNRQLQNAENTKVQALSELEEAKQTVQDLTDKIKAVKESKESIIKATDAARNQAKKLEEVNSIGLEPANGAWKQDLDSTREQYTAAITELDAAKQELRKICQDFKALMEAKVAAFQQVAEAGYAVETNKEKAGELSREIAAVQESLGHVKIAIVQAQQDRENNLAEKDAQGQSYKTALEEAEKKLLSLRKEFNPEPTRNLQAKLAETAVEIEALEKEIEDARASDLDSVKTVTLELDDAKDALQKVAEEESSLQSLVESLKLELETIKKEHSDLKEKEAETESVAGNLHAKLQKSKNELEAALALESKAKGASDELISTLQQLTAEAENARVETETMKKNAEELKKEAQATRTVLEETERKLLVALKEAEEAKAAEAMALDQIKVLSERTNASRASPSESGANITISTEEFESLSRKVEESDKLAEMKVAAAMAQVEAVKASENEALKRLEATQKEIEEIKAATEEALKKAEMAEEAKRAIEGELRRWREREQKKAVEAATLILAEADVSVKSSPHYAQVQKPNSKARKVEKPKKCTSKKALWPSLSGFFNRKKSKVEGGSPSYLPGEKPV
ncbi:PREDICTED: WEB family protein At5g55860-like [Nelumbo nucifera]|uniref:WEB family protein At5g55860-like n=2 Tax=Nelumbo nucifera TaxID=4432 RepID=A0A1U7ZM63_NELNU|nr:PREDICTED: WEB family protein At5g55860-like [Nelumbo nucifera]DAD23696.1 TPA_asm: hypothetical protein HUJ06_025159 [Nelumbo nucifera]